MENKEVQKNKYNKNVPHFIIVGTMKSGTSLLRFHLKNHKKVHLPDKELHFFNRKDILDQGLNWYENKILENKKKQADKKRSRQRITSRNIDKFI